MSTDGVECKYMTETRVNGLNKPTGTILSLPYNEYVQMFKDTHFPQFMNLLSLKLLFITFKHTS